MSSCLLYTSFLCSEIHAVQAMQRVHGFFVKCAGDVQKCADLSLIHISVFFFFTNKILCSCSIFQNLFLVVDCTTSKCYSCLLYTSIHSSTRTVFLIHPPWDTAHPPPHSCSLIVSQTSRMSKQFLRS